MAHFVENDKGFLIIEMTVNEAITQCGFGYGNELVCDSCNKPYFIDDEQLIYYITVLNMAYCKECCDEFIANATRYKEDILTEKARAEYYAKLLHIDNSFTGE